MPKDRRERSVSLDRFRTSPFPCSSGKSKQTAAELPEPSPETEENIREWEDARCPVCMEHPHNAVLLICTSHDKGCHPYMCDTSYRHSNCLDQFRKSFVALSAITPLPDQDQASSNSSSITFEEGTTLVVSPTLENGSLTNANSLSEESLVGSGTEISPPLEASKLLCPLCRGNIKEWVVVDAARSFMNAKSRNCASETCDFSGTYTELRKHARVEHPLARPTEANPERQRNWRRMERQRDLGDLLSTLQSSFEEERGEEDSILPIDERGWLTVFFLIRVFQPGSDSRSSSWSGASRARAPLGSRRRSTRLWGESYDGETLSFLTEDGNESSDGGSSPWRHFRRTRRRTTPDDRS